MQQEEAEDDAQSIDVDVVDERNMDDLEHWRKPRGWETR